MPFARCGFLHQPAAHVRVRTEQVTVWYRSSDRALSVAHAGRMSLHLHHSHQGSTSPLVPVQGRQEAPCASPKSDSMGLASLLQGWQE